VYEMWFVFVFVCVGRGKGGIHAKRERPARQQDDSNQRIVHDGAYRFGTASPKHVDPALCLELNILAGANVQEFTGRPVEGIAQGLRTSESRE